MAGDGVGPPQQLHRRRHIARGQRLAHGGAGDAHTCEGVAFHVRDFKALRLPALLQQRAVASALGAKAKIVAHQHITCAQTAHQHLVDKRLRWLRGQIGVKRQHHRLLYAALRQLAELVAQRANARRGQRRLI